MSESAELPSSAPKIVTENFIDKCVILTSRVAAGEIGAAIGYGILRTVGVDLDPAILVPAVAIGGASAGVTSFLQRRSDKKR